MEAPRRVLVIDHSKVVRSTLAKHLRDHFEVREESDGESAWQTLVLDSSIVAVVSGMQQTRLSGYELLARLRASKLRRLCDLPFLLIVSGSESADDRLHAKTQGVTDFITRGMTRQEIVTHIARLGNWDTALSLTNPVLAAQAEANDAPPPPPVSGLLSSTEIAARLESATAGLPGTNGMVSVLKFGLDNHAELTERLGSDTVQAIATRVACLLKEKIGQGDSIGRSSPFRCLIVSPGSSLATCVAFAQRVCRGLANSHITVRGEAVKLRISAGVASTPADGQLSAEELIVLAGERLDQAQRAGGERVAFERKTIARTELATGYFDELIQLYRPSTENHPLGSVGLHLMPLLKVLETEFHLDLPLTKLEERFALRAREEQGFSGSDTVCNGAFPSFQERCPADFFDCTTTISMSATTKDSS